MKYPLEDLLRVRNFREDNAANELTKRRRAVEAAEDLVKQRKRELEEYIQWRIQREEELYREVMQKPVQLKELDDLKQDIQLLREKESLYEERIREAENGVVQAKEALVLVQCDGQDAVLHR